jgi:hypothetical protein
MQKMPSGTRCAIMAQDMAFALRPRIGGALPVDLLEARPFSVIGCGGHPPISPSQDILVERLFTVFTISWTDCTTITQEQSSHRCQYY